MTDPMDALRAPVQPVDPDPIFADDLRERLRRAVLGPTGASEMTAQKTVVPESELGWGPTLSPYIAVSDARAAIDWYLEVFDAHQRGEVYEMEDGAIGHAEIGIGDAVLMLAEGGVGDVPVTAPDSPRTFSTTLHVQVPDVDATVALAEQRGAAIERRPEDQPYGRVAAFVDPFGHRWLLNTPPPTATRHRVGEIAYTTMVVADDEKAKAFYGAVLGWEFESGSLPHAWGVPGMADFGIWGDRSQRPEVQLCYRVNDLDAALERVRANNGTAEEIQRKPYGLMVECTDDQGARFQLWAAP
ncbi:Uncharacterized conserved protein PhnB, glyoxalase superfamily [Actinokineospora alba]|uniref:Uncharacterized conserved protein PhnB, glyoxalase superfamily n=1 Tax=Actinokineospora alba TaxID=504798 RepID=A0A1H0FHZ9_9PSEU|nr:VOC family protein [Actinokineospora alba]TDP69481.1 putative glyoxalase superfamily protein PhnB [Actinokineospora alba]SDI15807.1 Uncharacterized conserved protein PhnB, glyoxalase superfamily [Actinokineospora alba]SDN94049.1 Uncharacterized conserved protein PhnB, glyoxalase superfamily [Actinokineospora alba]